jgi:hypothetical protein
VVYASLERPRSEPRNVDSLFYADGQVLMPRYEPVRVWSLVEQNAPDCNSAAAHRSLGQRLDVTRLHKDKDLGHNLQQVTNA